MAGEAGAPLRITEKRVRLKLKSLSKAVIREREIEKAAHLQTGGAAHPYHLRPSPAGEGIAANAV